MRQACLEKRGAPPHCRPLYDASRRKTNLFATFGPDGDGGFRASGHTDVVPVELAQGLSSNPFKPGKARLQALWRWRPAT